MVASNQTATKNFSAWNPGISSEIPVEYRELETIHDLANVTSRIREVTDLSSATGLPIEELVSFTPSRLVLHEVIVRVTADIVVMEGEKEEDLGINFRIIANSILDKYVQPGLDDIEKRFAQRKEEVEKKVGEEIATLLDVSDNVTASGSSFISRLFARKKARHKQSVLDREASALGSINSYKQRGLESGNELEAAVYRSLYRVLGAMIARRGYIGRDNQLLENFCSRHALNYVASQDIRDTIGPLLDDAIASENYQVIPDAEKPILFSLKGASAAGKSSLRPRLRELMIELGIGSNAYGTISPDIWRRLLIDYDGLGEAYKYAGRLSSKEVNVIDDKLDRYIRDKAEQRQALPHLMVDRFRFDSFDSEKVSRVLQDTYVRHIDTMYMYFIITPPEATVERGWLRGLERGRYKAVEDFLGHCVEAYVGMPKLLFKYVGKTRPKYRFEFLDNSVPRGTFPSLVARGSQDLMQVHRLEPLINIERYQRINELATSTTKVHAAAEELIIPRNLKFIRQCINTFTLVEFLEPESERLYLQVKNGSFSVIDPETFKSMLDDEVIYETLACLAPELVHESG